MKYFSDQAPVDSSQMTRWRKRIGEAGAEQLLEATLKTGLKLKAIKSSQIQRVNVETTVQPKAIRYPTDSRLYERARQHLVKAAKKRAIPLRQNYNRLGKQLLRQQSRYAHARQMKRAASCTKKLRNYLGRVMREINRRVPSPDKELKNLLNLAEKLYDQQRNDRNKIYSIHEPEVACIAKGKAHKRYEFGSKVSVAFSSKGAWCLGAKAFKANPYDGHTLIPSLQQVQRLLGRLPKQLFLDRGYRGYRGHGYEGLCEIHIDRVRRAKCKKSLWAWMKRRNAIEPSIGHLKSDHKLGYNRLKGIEGDQVNAILSAAALKFHKLLQYIDSFLRLFLQKLIKPVFYHLLSLSCLFFPLSSFSLVS